jgi:hypothetical protein
MIAANADIKSPEKWTHGAHGIHGWPPGRPGGS